jgi:hypothetical protein
MSSNTWLWRSGQRWKGTLSIVGFYSVFVLAVVNWLTGYNFAFVGLGLIVVFVGTLVWSLFSIVCPDCGHRPFAAPKNTVWRYWPQVYWTLQRCPKCGRHGGQQPP